jgi:putative membrane protein
MVELLLPAIHLCALTLGVAVLMQRAKALALAGRPEDLKRVFFWDNLYALVALFWLGSGLLRAFAGYEKGSDYYLSNHAFWGKMLLLLVLLAHEGVLMVTFVRWRIALRKNQPVSLERKPRLLRLHWAEVWAVVGMVVLATAMARGYGTNGKPAATPVSARPGAAEASTLAQLAAGKTTYQSLCLPCHQADGRGYGGKVAADFVTDPTRLAKSDAALARSIAHGVPGTLMRGFAAELGEDEIRNVLSYIRHSFGANP